MTGFRYFKSLEEYLRTEYNTEKVYPPAVQVFNALNLCPFENVKVVLLGQGITFNTFLSDYLHLIDPYHGPGQAHGLCFSVAEGIPLPPSLKNIFNELQEDVGVPPSNSGDLQHWARQGK